MLVMVQSYGRLGVEAWQWLIKVCGRWRNVVFESPRRLNLRLHCTPETPAKDGLDVWPALPLVIAGMEPSSGTDNVVAALRESNRVRQVNLDLAGWQWEEVFTPMQVSSPELTELRLMSNDKWLTPYSNTPVIPDSFLGGSAPRLRFLSLHSVIFPGLPKLLLSATQLVEFYLHDCGYISPGAIVAHLSALSGLEVLHLLSLYP